MKLYDGGLLLALFSVLTLSIVVGLSAHYQGEDNSIEEAIEMHLEKALEKKLDLPKDALKDKIDLTPWSDEDNDIDAIEKLLTAAKPGIDD